ncbi:hypothetical protein TWF569_010417 [Orbilia oligospora]|uniref:Uncharacterized protein n=1 Tax=Orbilia oligospora TaxID=2813651 RepID=A0A7C8JU77_ORBOL|nr:hypothetical protein TWF706_006175 [Orbilia oligospora]KAF3126233.1 hypothetical protein TWF703_010491 [Orbilia oligospora]KAF3133730.1 hypothetical protein TWF569_010417 [Orbilia oligospora]
MPAKGFKNGEVFYFRPCPCIRLGYPHTEESLARLAENSHSGSETEVEEEPEVTESEVTESEVTESEPTESEIETPGRPRPPPTQPRPNPNPPATPPNTPNP